MEKKKELKSEALIEKIITDIIEKKPGVKEEEFCDIFKDELIKNNIDPEKYFHLVYYDILCSAHGSLGTYTNRATAELKRIEHIKDVPYPFHSNLVKIMRDDWQNDITE